MSQITDTAGTCDIDIETSNQITIRASTSSNGMFIPIGLSAEEQKELNQLEKEFTLSKKEKRLLNFKNMSQENRTAIISLYDYHNNVVELQEEPQVSDRLAELRNKNWSHLSGLSWAHHAEFAVSMVPRLPPDITLEDLKMAHADACAEEALTDQTES